MRRAAGAHLHKLWEPACPEREILPAMWTRGSRERELPAPPGLARSLYSEAPRREDPHLEERAGRRAQARHRALRGSARVAGAPRHAGSGRCAQASRSRPRADDGGGPSLRGHRQPGHGRRDHGAVRRAPGPRRSRGEGVLCRAPHAGGGEAVVRAIGSDLRMDYSAVGQTTHLAARMEQMAEPGSILATADTFGLVKGYVDALPLGPRSIRGLQAVVEVYLVTGTGIARWPMEVAAARGLTSFVGREEELAQLDAAMQTAARGHGRVVGLVGEPGVGKSRLFYEFARRERMPGWRIGKTGAFSYDKSTAYRPVIDLL